jgi:hypothetical protein
MAGDCKSFRSKLFSLRTQRSNWAHPKHPGWNKMETRCTCTPAMCLLNINKVVVCSLFLIGDSSVWSQYLFNFIVLSRWLWSTTYNFEFKFFVHSENDNGKHFLSCLALHTGTLSTLSSKCLVPVELLAIQHFQVVSCQHQLTKSKLISVIFILLCTELILSYT